jgi:hypothetical protein
MLGGPPLSLPVRVPSKAIFGKSQQNPWIFPPKAPCHGRISRVFSEGKPVSPCHGRCKWWGPWNYPSLELYPCRWPNGWKLRVRPLKRWSIFRCLGEASASNIGNTPIDGPAGSHMVRKVLLFHLFPALAAWFFLGDSGGIILTHKKALYPPVN